MHALLIGLSGGYFFVACAPVRWSREVLFLIGGLALLLIALLYLARRQRSVAIPGQYWPTAVSGGLALLLGAVVACSALGTNLYRWQEDRLIFQAEGFGCEPGALQELMRLEVVALPSRTPDGSRFDAEIVAVRAGCKALLGQQVRVSWKAARWPVTGQRILAQVRLGAVRGSVSPGAFDHELHLARRGIRLSAWLGRTLSVSEPHEIVAGRVARARLAVRRSLEGMELAHPGVLLALLTGDSVLMPRRHWELLQATGTLHLLVISGLHVGLIALGLLFVVRALVRVLTLFVRRIQTSWLRLAEALLTSVLLYCYVLFVGSGVAAVRALMMAVVLLIAWSLGRQVLASALLVVVAVVVMVGEPRAGLSAGFWLSFGLVAWLILRQVPLARTPPDTQANPRQQALRRSWQLCRRLLGLHVGCALVLLPMLAWLGLPVAPVSPVANLLAVPVVTVVLVPLVLAGGLLLPVSVDYSARLFGLADIVAGELLGGLAWMSSTVPGVDLPLLDGQGYVAAGFLLLTVLLPTPVQLRVVLVLLLLGVCWFPGVIGGTGDGRAFALPTLAALRAPSIEPGQFEFQVLDVGQGLAVVVYTHQQTLLYDTGASFASGFNFADAVIAPALKTRRVPALDTLIVSHHDLDHAGSLPRVLGLFKPRRLLGTLPGARCAEAESAAWRVDGVSFNVLQHHAGQSSNDRSCVLVVRGAKKTAVIAGDIEAAAERALLPLLPLDIDLLVVPHHGSKTSSTAEFVESLRPDIALISAGFRNRYGHPHPDVVERYRRVGSKVLTTAAQGTLAWRSADSGQPLVAERSQRLERWQLGAPLLISR